MTRRVARLFRPYRGRLAAVLALIAISAGLGMVSPFLLRDILDEAIPSKDRDLLLMLVGGMIAISVATGVLGVAQTWLSNVVGQRVMHDLRAKVYRHLQRLSLAFFTRTRTGEIQSRIANDIGGVQTVVTTTATSIVSNVTTVLASVVAMFLLDWRLALFSLAVLPFFVGLSRRVGAKRKAHHHRQAGRDGRHLLARPGVAQRLRHPARQDDGPLGRAGRPLRRASPRGSPTSRSARAWRAAGRWPRSRPPSRSCPRSSTCSPGLSPSAVSIGTVVAFTTLQTRLFWPISSLLNVAVDVQTSTALFERVFEYLDLPVDIHPGTRELGAVARRGPLRGRVVPLRRASGRCATSTSRSRPARARRSSARPARARRRSATSPRASTTPSAAPC